MSEKNEPTLRNDSERDRASKTRRFFASELPWFLIAVYCLWNFIAEPTIAAAQHSALPAVSARNDTSESVFAVAIAPTVQRTESATMQSGEIWGIRFGRDGEFPPTGPVVVTVYATDGSILERWEEFAETLAPLRPQPRELIVQQPARNDAEVTP